MQLVIYNTKSRPFNSRCPSPYIIALPTWHWYLSTKQSMKIMGCKGIREADSLLLRILPLLMMDSINIAPSFPIPLLKSLFIMPAMAVEAVAMSMNLEGETRRPLFWAFCFLVSFMRICPEHVPLAYKLLSSLYPPQTFSFFCGPCSWSAQPPSYLS